MASLMAEDYRLGELDNPDGFPVCPVCKEFVQVDDKDNTLYWCSECDRKFPLEEAID